MKTTLVVGAAAALLVLAYGQGTAHALVCDSAVAADATVENAGFNVPVGFNGNGLLVAHGVVRMQLLGCTGGSPGCGYPGPNERYRLGACVVDDAGTRGVIVHEDCHPPVPGSTVSGTPLGEVAQYDLSSADDLFIPTTQHIPCGQWAEDIGGGFARIWSAEIIPLSSDLVDSSGSLDERGEIFAVNYLDGLGVYVQGFGGEDRIAGTPAGDYLYSNRLPFLSSPDDGHDDELCGGFGDDILAGDEDNNTDIEYLDGQQGNGDICTGFGPGPSDLASSAECETISLAAPAPPSALGCQVVADEPIFLPFYHVAECFDPTDNILCGPVSGASGGMVTWGYNGIW